MADVLDHDTLGHEVTARRKELGLSIRDATELSRRIDVEVNGEPGRKPGLGDTTWTKIGQGVDTRRYPHTLHLIDQTLRWSAGTAHALLHGDEPPAAEGAANGPCPCRDARTTGATVKQVLDPVERGDQDDDVALLCRQVIRLINRVEDLDEEVRELRRFVTSRDQDSP